MNTPTRVTQERFLARATLADERATRSDELAEKSMWEDIARCWRELARQCVGKPG